MADFEPEHATYESRVRDSFAAQNSMALLGITLDAVAPGRITLTMPYSEDLSQQHGFIHAGMLATALDSACGYAAFTLMPEDAEVLTIEFKVNLMAPADGERFVFEAEVVKPGRTVTFAHATAYAIKDGQQKAVATMACTLMTIRGRAGINR